ncbi:MAG: FGGY-family carbohydrate kinase, partial [Acidimicrobiales bacterium]
RSLLEETAFGVRHNLDAMAAVSGGQTRLVAVGGGVTGGLWPQIVSDVTGLAQDLPAQGVGASYGHALLAARAIGATPEERSWATVQTTVGPTTSMKTLYDEMYDLYLDLYPATARHAHAMAELQKLGGSAARHTEGQIFTQPYLAKGADPWR